jgi:Bacterial Ig-like domain
VDTRRVLIAVAAALVLLVSAGVAYAANSASETTSGRDEEDSYKGSVSAPDQSGTSLQDAAKITRSTVQLVDTTTGKRVGARVSYDEATQTVTLNPFGTSMTLLAKNTKYKVTITTGAKNLAGISLDQNPRASGSQPKVWFFTTGLKR